MRRYGYRTVFAVGALLLGGPALALLAPRSVVTIVAVSIAAASASASTPSYPGPRWPQYCRRSGAARGIGLAGVVACVPAIVVLPSGVWLAENTGYAVVMAITAPVR